MRIVLPLLLLTLTSTATAKLSFRQSRSANQDKQDAQQQHLRRRRTKKANGAAMTGCGILGEWAAELWSDVTAQDCQYADENRDELSWCISGPLKLGGINSCSTHEECSAVDPLSECIVRRDASGRFATSECGTKVGIALDLGVSELVLHSICPKPQVALQVQPEPQAETAVP